MAARGVPILASTLRSGRRSLALWSLAVAAVTALYVAFYPSMGGEDMQAAIRSMPQALVTALGYDRIHTPGGYLESTVYGLLGPILLLVFAIGGGAQLIAGQEEDGTLELALTAPVARRRLLAERLAALWLNVAVLVVVVTLTTVLLVAVLGIDLPLVHVLAGSSGLLLLVLAFGTLALSIGAATGRKGIALAATAALAVAAFVSDALAPVVGADWMAAMSPFSWFLAGEPLREGFDPSGLAKLALLTLAAVALGVAALPRRDLMT